MFDTPIFTLEDVRSIRNDTSINIEDFAQYAMEAQRNYLRKLLGAKLYTALVTSPTDTRMVSLLDGEIYNDGQDIIFDGVKLYLCYLWLYLYTNQSSVALTPIGARIFNDEFAEEASNRKQTRDLGEHFLKSADGLEETILDYLDKHRSTYPEFSESPQIKQASNDNIGFKVVGKSYKSPDNFGI
jgi:hypothetical protein